MKNHPSVALLISTYNWPEALDLVLGSVLKQSVLPTEVIIADDGSAEETRSLINNYKKNFPVSLHHIWHEDNGFTKTLILNKAIAKIKSDYIIQIDGDIILHKHFVKDHLNACKDKMFLYGTRVTITKEKSLQLMAKKKADLNIFSSGLKKRMRILYLPFVYKNRKPDAAISTKLRGANMSYWRKDAIEINGYNEDFLGWGFEDYDFGQRLTFLGVMPKRLKFAGICFHIYHKKAVLENPDKGNEIQNKTIEGRIKRCENGIDKYLKDN
ncbi:glycosyltransferase [Aquimarina sp. BL5]|uniref:glycosyltransferase family 2 protein n=1 Tax=Aquimarina sp. BL5 TaxID=1714860 RepID=UPI000E51EDC6|nr:glycosyltransferase family 2 protein [Aquimarina sp. BL5]AXT50729.1 glycosyltransferase [Aquimarina sp. BL5]RKN08248.1 glycosyltransferase [Aquimarina sp. BL5]